MEPEGEDEDIEHDEVQTGDALLTSHQLMPDGNGSTIRLAGQAEYEQVMRRME